MISLSLPVSADDLSEFLGAVRGYLADNGTLLRGAQR